MSLRAILALVLLIGGAGSGWYARSVIADRDEAQALAAQAADINRRQMRAQETSDAAFLQAQARVAAVRRADAAGNGLRIASEAIVAAAATTTPGECQATADAARVLADLLGGVESAGRDMARIADERGAAGAACERIATDNPEPEVKHGNE